jgi:hypothetical protein
MNTAEIKSKIKAALVSAYFEELNVIDFPLQDNNPVTNNLAASEPYYFSGGYHVGEVNEITPEQADDMESDGLKPTTFIRKTQTRKGTVWAPVFLYLANSETPMSAQPKAAIETDSSLHDTETSPLLNKSR